MIREKILRLHKQKSSSVGTNDASAEKIDFTFSNIQALQVPKGWDKLFISIISSETGKTATKTSKGSVKNGTCQWTETLSESVWISSVDGYIFKFLVGMGFSKTSILGEATLDLASFLSSEVPILVSLPLKKCNYGTILQVEIKCLNPIPNLRDEKWKNMYAYTNENADEKDVENKSEVSDCTTTKSVESRLLELGSRERSVSTPFSRYSFDSMEGSVGRQSFSSQSNLSSTRNDIRRQDSIESHDSESICSYSTFDSPISLQRNSGSSKNFKETNDETVEVLKAEARMWEKNARKLRIDVEYLRKELSDQCLNMTDLNMELASSRLECQKRIQQIKDSKSPSQNSSSENYEFHERTRTNLLKEFEDEMRFQKESNRNLSLQLRKTQESNLELISLLQEMEETVEITLQDRAIESEIEQYIKNIILKDFEVECNSVLAAKEQEIVNHVTKLDEKLLVNRVHLDSSKEIEHLKEKVHELETDYHEITEENLELLFQLKEKQKSVSKGSNTSSNFSSRESSISCVSDEGIYEPENEMVKHLLDIEEENVYLSQRISGLEAHLRYLTEETESSRLELHHSESQATILRIEIKSLEEEIESQKLDIKHKLREVQNKLSEAQEEFRNLSKVNIKLQATTESLIEEYNSLHEFNGELREEKLKLQSKCIFLEAEVRKFQDSLKRESSEIEVESIIHDLDSKTKLSEVERLLRLEEENSILQRKLEKIPELQNEVLALRLSLDEMKSKNQIMEASFKSVSRDYKELERANNSMSRKILNLQMEISETENCQRKRVALEEKILRLEGDLIARDALCVLGAEMKIELNQIKRANTEFQTKIKHLEDARKELQRKVQSFEVQNQLHVIKLPKEEDDGSMSVDQDPEMDYESRIQILEKEFLEALEANDMYKLQLQTAHEAACMARKSSEITDSKILILEAELQEIRERYLQISLKYAEVEDQREELVMKLKTVNSCSSFSYGWNSGI